MLLYNEVVKQTLNLLHLHKDEWETRYNGYLTKIKKNENKQVKFETPVKKPLFVYTTVSNETKTNPKWYLRFMGQNVGILLKKDNEILLCLRQKDYDNNRDAFKDDTFDIEPGDYRWDDCPEAIKFRDFFKNYGGKKHKKNHEHTVESAFLSDLEKKKGKNKKLKGIQPVEIRKKRFQMPTPLKASNLYKVTSKELLSLDDYFKYAAQYGGGIDILARRRNKKQSVTQSFITVIELKDKQDKKEPPEKVMYQAIAYATFIHELIRSNAADGIGWYNLFLDNKKRKIPDELVIKCVVAMPGLNVVALDKELGKNNLNVLMPFNNSKDKLELLFINLDDKTYGVKDYSEKL